MLSELLNLRKKIDRTDKEIVLLLSRRFKLTKKVGIYKKKNRLKPYDRMRETEMMERRIEWGKINKLDGAFIKKIFRMITAAVRENHRRITGEKYGRSQ